MPLQMGHSTPPKEGSIEQMIRGILVGVFGDFITGGQPSLSIRFSRYQNSLILSELEEVVKEAGNR